MSTGPIKGESVDTRRYSPTRRISGELRLARQGLNWLLHKWGEPAISLPVLYQLDPGPIGETGTARKVCENPRRPRLARTHRRGRHGCWRPTPRGLADRTGMTMAAFRRFDPYAVLGEDKHLDREGLAGLAATRLETQNRPHMLTTPRFRPCRGKSGSRGHPC